MSAGTIAVPWEADSRSFTLPDVKGWVKSKFRKPPRPPWEVVKWFLWTLWSAWWCVYDVLRLIGVWNPESGRVYYATAMVFWLAFGYVWSFRHLRHEWVKWRNEDRDEPKRVPPKPGLQALMLVTATWLVSLFSLFIP